MAEQKPSVCIIVAAHKQYRMPADPMYLPLHVGAEGKTDADGNELDLGYTKDNTGDHISGLNPSFCELTGLYWAWKNLDADYLGLVHYRRHFAIKRSGPLWDRILTYRELKPWLGHVKVFTPKPRRYYIETLYSHYAHTHYASHLDETRRIIAEKYPSYLESCDRIYNRTGGYMFNMMIMEKEFFDEYCTWVFDILFELKQRTDGKQKLSAFQSRFYGRVSEIIFNVWIEEQLKTGKLKKNEILEIPLIHMEKINWGKKGTAFLKAKFIGKKYEGSF